MKVFRNPIDIAPPLAAYVHQIEISGHERLLVISGQVGQNGDGFVPEDPIEQLTLALENLKRNLAAAHMVLEDLVKLNFYLVGEIDTAKRRDILAAFLGEHRPCMTLIYVAGLAGPKYRVEVEAWASRSSDDIK
jgi:enamine deaminase RidA (YjgF/YER057c/UK114 family)